MHDIPAGGDDLNEVGLLYLGNHGSGVGGARPKALFHDDSQCYLGKFNHSRDLYNNARVELACLLMAQAAGYGYQPNPPRPSDALKLGKVLDMPRPVVARAAEHVIEAVSQWPAFAEQAGVQERDSERVERVLRP